MLLSTTRLTFSVISSPAAPFGSSGPEQLKPGRSRPLLPDQTRYLGLGDLAPVRVTEPRRHHLWRRHHRDAAVLGAHATDQFGSWAKTPPVAGTAEQIAQDLAPEAWTRLSAGDGTKGPRLYDWAYVELADLEAAEYNDQHSGLWTRGLLIRRSIADQDLAFFSTWCPAGTPIDTLVRVEGRRWAIEDAFETAKTELGLTHNETRSWHGWHRHVALVMLAFAMMATVRQRANSLSSPQKRTADARLQRWCDGLSRTSAAWPHASPSAGSSQRI